MIIIDNKKYRIVKEGESFKLERKFLLWWIPFIFKFYKLNSSYSTHHIKEFSLEFYFLEDLKSIIENYKEVNYRKFKIKPIVYTNYSERKVGYYIPHFSKKADSGYYYNYIQFNTSLKDCKYYIDSYYDSINKLEKRIISIEEYNNLSIKPY